MKKEKEPIPFRTDIFEAEDKLLQELQKSDNIEDQLTAILMEPHVQKTPEDNEDSVGLWSNCARAKAQQILKRFECKPKQWQLTFIRSLMMFTSAADRSGGIPIPTRSRRSKML